MSLSPMYVLLGEMFVQVLCPFFNWIACLPGVDILDIQPLPEVSLANKFSLIFGSLFILLMFSLAVQKLFNLM